MKTLYKCLFLSLGLCLLSTHLIGQSISFNPASGLPGSSFGVTITGVGTSWAASPTHCVEIFDGTTTLSFTGTTVSTTTLTGTVSIPLGATIGAYQARVFSTPLCSGATNGTCTNCFTVLPPTITVAPSSGIAGHTQTLTITGTGTNWTIGSSHCVTLTNGTTTLNFTGTASAANSITGSLTIPFSASTSANYDVRVFDSNAGACTGSSLVCTGCFAVTPAPAIAISPDSGSLGSVFPVTLTGANVQAAGTSTHCVQLTNGASSFSFTATKASGSTNLTGTISVPAGAILGDYAVVVFPNGSDCLGNNIGYCATCFEVVTLPSALDQPETELAFSLFPNPNVTDALTVSFGKPTSDYVSLDVYDLMGKRMQPTTLLAPNQSEAVINIARLSRGMYFLTATENGAVITRRFVRQ